MGDNHIFGALCLDAGVGFCLLHCPAGVEQIVVRDGDCGRLDIVVLGVGCYERFVYRALLASTSLGDALPLALTVAV